MHYACQPCCVSRVWECLFQKTSVNGGSALRGWGKAEGDSHTWKEHLLGVKWQGEGSRRSPDMVKWQVWSLRIFELAMERQDIWDDMARQWDYEGIASTKLLVNFLGYRWSWKVAVSKLFLYYFIMRQFENLSFLKWKYMHNFLLSTKLWRQLFFFKSAK